MDLIGGYGSDVSDDDQRGPANGTADAHSGGKTVPAEPATSAKETPAVSEQLARLPAPKAADNDRWGSVFGTGILEKKRQPAAISRGVANGAASGAVANGLSGEEGVQKRKLVSFMAPLTPLTAEELNEDRPKKKTKSAPGAGGSAASFLGALPPPKHHGGGDDSRGGGGVVLGGGLLGSGAGAGGTGLDLSDAAEPSASHSMASSATAGGRSSGAAPPPAVAFTNDLYRVADGDDNGGGVDYGPAAYPPADYEAAEAPSPAGLGGAGWSNGSPDYDPATFGRPAAHYVEHAAAAGPSGYMGPLTSAQPKQQRDGDVMLAASLAAEQQAAAKRAGDDPFTDLGVDFVEVNQKELTYVPPAQKEAQAGVRAALGPAYEQKLRAEADKVLPSKISKRKHQINSLYHAAKMKELELLEKRGQSLKTKAETQAKYGW